MKKYRVQVYDSTFERLQAVLSFKLETSQTNSGAVAFRDEIFRAIERLETMPHIGKALNKNYQAKVVMEHWLVYEVDEENAVVYVSDIIDPQQHSKASQYF